MRRKDNETKYAEDLFLRVFEFLKKSSLCQNQLETIKIKARLFGGVVFFPKKSRCKQANRVTKTIIVVNNLDENLVVSGVYFDHKGETPGLGANIKMRFFMDDFAGESIYRDGEYKGVAVVKGNNDPLNEDKTDGQVDALAGATITGNGVTAMINESVKLYQPYLETLRIQ